MTISGAGGTNVWIAPSAFQFYARDFYGAYRAYRPSRPFSPARLFLVARSIELAAKALHLAQGRSAKDLRRVDHDLIHACDDSILRPDEKPLEAVLEKLLAVKL